jgi:hypothetical protein
VPATLGDEFLIHHRIRTDEPRQRVAEQEGVFATDPPLEPRQIRSARSRLRCVLSHSATSQRRDAAAANAGHSLRAGLVTAAKENRAPDHIIMANTGHANPKTLAGYARVADLAEQNVGRYTRLSPKLREESPR